MIQQARDKVKKHIKTHSEHSVEDRAAISLLGTFLNPGGRINTSFAANDTWPNHDGTFEFISNPDVSRRPKQNFFVQIKGTSVYTEKDGIIKYSLKSLAFPAYICDNVSFDPGILFVVLDPDQRGSQRVFWKYMSVDFINSINFDQDMITEKLVINGPYSEDIGPNVFKRECEDEVILCLNYDGKFGLNNMNNYFQAANTKGEAIPWAEWSYKVGDPILFNDSKRFDLLYNNLKGRIVDIEKHSGSISFTVDVEIPLTELMCKRDGIEFIESIENGTRIRFAVYEYDESKKGEDLDENLRLKSVVPFQLAYAVSIHKAQGLEYDSVKVIIPSNNAEKITHGIFYTAITRAKTNLKIYWSSETMHDVVKGFATDESKRKSLEIVKTKLGKN